MKLANSGCTLLASCIPQENLPQLSTEYLAWIDKIMTQVGVKAMEYKVDKFEIRKLEPKVDQRAWKTNGGNKKLCILFALQELKREHGAFMFVPYSQTMRKEPTNEQLSRQKFRNQKDHKLYDMRKMYIEMNQGDVAILDGFLWSSIGLNDTTDTTEFGIATLTLV
jgi:hypothetical protein